MPKSKKRKVSPKGKRNEDPITKRKLGDRPWTTKEEISYSPPSHSVDGYSLRRPEKRILTEPSRPQPIFQVSSNTRKPAPPSKVHPKAKHVRPPEIQELCGRPDPVATVTAENFKRMGHDLQSNMRGVFHDLNSAMGKASATADPDFLMATKQPHRRETRASAHSSKQFFKTLVPKDKVPEQDEHIKVEFEGTNTIKTDAPGYTETITFGDSCWRRTRIHSNSSGMSIGHTETGKLDNEEGARIAEQTKQMIDRIMRYTANNLAGMMSPERMTGKSPDSARLALSPNGLRAPRTSVSIPTMTRGGSGMRGASRVRGGGGLRPSRNFKTVGMRTSG